MKRAYAARHASLRPIAASAASSSARLPTSLSTTSVWYGPVTSASSRVPVSPASRSSACSSLRRGVASLALPKCSWKMSGTCSSLHPGAEGYRLLARRLLTQTEATFGS